MSRERLPNRRPAVTSVLDYGGTEYLLSVGFTTQGRAREVFLDGYKTGSEIEKLIDDACIVISRLLQFGDRPHKIFTAIAGEDDAKGDRSLIGAIMARVLKIEHESGTIIAEVERHRSATEEAHRETIASAFA